ncbi:Phenazine biosynthesis PhzC/PhzF protein [Lasiodiplodia theobromae]|uniref:Putative isomerase n=1 Tax=Lasiodiplodia theobromae TaxID=45133 RepID=A0A5N5DRL6_9PEZI|nr:Phenazine biosynthesis PhzC/PhzF protein [Lasiodiplodia theobromae]KAB2580021.1 putative isomerase [Lasiodiplodia theobromae]KAF4540954.1 Phenazine biosynthesis PhzC/PhzF protein [Lasiodiplodia theobromae]KAF9634561.1 Phenazine biosynthesis PhzC/PhzF protein [Lasiodiplodia theobromae]
MEYCTLDVFTRHRFAGNPLAVVKVPATVALTQGQKQLVAREFNFSETVFLHERRGGENTWKIDIFITTAEIPFAGHPTIGTACLVLSQLPGQADAAGIIEGKFLTKAGEIRLKYSTAEALASAEIPHDVRIHGQRLSRSLLLEMQPSMAILSSPTMPRVPEQMPVVSIVRGMTFALVEVDSLATLGAAATGTFTVDVALDEGWDQSFVALYFYFRLPDSADGTRNLRTRMIEGGLEDPATGSAASALACFLSLAEGVAGQTHRYAVTQGVEMGRKSEIGVQVGLAKTEGEIESVQLSGAAVEVMEGRLAT